MTGKQSSKASLMASVAIVFIGNAYGQDLKTDPPKNVEFSADASVSVIESFTDNVFYTANDREADFLTILRPEVMFSAEGQTFNFSAGGAVDVGRFFDNTSEDFTDISAGIDGEVQVLDGVAVFGGVQISFDHEGRGSPDDVNGIEPTEFTETSGYFGVAGELDDITVRVGTKIEQLDFDDTPAANGNIINNDDRDRRQIEVGTRLGYVLDADTEVFVQGVYDQRDYSSTFDDAGAERGSDGVQASVGLRGSYGAVSGEVSFGGLFYQYDDSQFGSVTTLDVGADLVWRVGPSTRVNALLERSIEETTVTGASSYTSTVAGARVTHRVAPDLSASAFGYLTQNDYNDISRTDHVSEFGGSLNYHLTPHVYLGAGYSYEQRLSNAAGAEYDRHNVFLRLGAELDPGYDPNGPVAQLGESGAYVGAYLGDGAVQTRVDGPRGGGRGQLIADFGGMGISGGLLGGYQVEVGSLVLGVEAEAGLDDKEWTHEANRDFTVTKSNQIGLSGIAGVKTNRGVVLFGRAGLVNAKFESDYARRGVSESVEERETGISLGAGAQFPISGNLSGRMEYIVTAYPDYDAGAPLGVADDNFANLENMARVGLVYNFGNAEAVDVTPINFSGLYAGGQIGHGAFQSDDIGLRPDAAAPNFQLSVTRAGQGVTGGVFGGYGHQFGDFYVGAEAELEISSADWNIERDPNGRIYSVEKGLSVGGSLRAGYVINDSILAYGRAGIVGTEVDTDYTFAGVTASSQEFLAGVRFGGGVEIGLDQNSSIRLDYTRTTYDDHSIDHPAGTELFDTSENLFRVGYTYRF